MKRYGHLAVASAAVIVICYAKQASAQVAPENDASPAIATGKARQFAGQDLQTTPAEVSKKGDIVVTVRRRSERLQDVGISSLTSPASKTMPAISTVTGATAIR
jgi:hypothetical protein